MRKLCGLFVLTEHFHGCSRSLEAGCVWCAGIAGHAEQDVQLQSVGSMLTASKCESKHFRLITFQQILIDWRAKGPGVFVHRYFTLPQGHLL